MPSNEARSLMFAKVGYQPNPAQAAVHFDNHRIKQVVGGVRAGKSTIGAKELLSQFWLGQLFWLIGADYEQCRAEFGYLVSDFERLGIIKPNGRSFPSRDQCRLEIEPNIVIETKSAKYVERIAGQAVDGIVMCEAAQMPRDIFTRCIERLVEKRGWLVMEGTLETSLDWYADVFKDYQIADNKDSGLSFSLPSWSNTAIFPGGRDDPEIVRAESICGHDLFIERYGGVPVKPKGLVFPEFKSILHTGGYPRVPKEPIFISIDPGWHPGAYAVEFLQFLGDDIYVVDEIYEQFMMHEQIITMVKQKPFYKDIIGGAIDIQAKQQTGRKPVWDIWREMTNLHLDTTRIQPIEDGVNTLRTYLLDPMMHGEPKLHIDIRCRGLISEFGGCKSPLSPEMNPNRGAWKRKMDRAGNVLDNKLEDRNCDAIKALIYGIVSERGFTTKRRRASVSQIAI